MATVSLTLHIDKGKNRVVFAESGRDFVDILFSFLTLPMGTIIRVLRKQSTVGCMDKLYKSVQDLDTQYMQTEACKNMLLQPRNEAESECKDLKVNVDDLQPPKGYVCQKWNSPGHCFFSMVCDVRCRCGEVMDVPFGWGRRNAEVDGVFTKGAARFIISDDLNVRPVSIEATLSLIQKIGSKNAQNLKQRTIAIGRDKILSLLKRCTLSTMPLSEVFLGRKPTTVEEPVEFEMIDTAQIEKGKDDKTKRIKVNLLINNASNKVVFARGDDFVDLLFSFLTLPLGSIIKLLRKDFILCCANNLYKSIGVLSNGTSYIKSKHYKAMLLDPKLSPHFGFSNQIIKIDEVLPKAQSVENHADILLATVNPKSPHSGIQIGGGFVKGPGSFMVTEELVVTPCSSTTILVKTLKIRDTDLEEREVSLGEAEALKLLKACLTSRQVLTDLFSLSF